MNTLGICSILYLVIIYAVDVCDAECDEYIVVLEESFCPNSYYSYRIKPLIEREINWDNVTYPCNATEKDLGKKKCLLEFDCIGRYLYCPPQIKQVHHETHYKIGDAQKTKPIRTELPNVTTRNITVTKKPTEAPDITTSNITVTKKLTEAPDVTTSNITVSEKPIESPDVTTSNITVTEKPTEASDFTTSNITVTEKLTEASDFTTRNITVTEKSTEAPDVTTSNITVIEKPTEAPDVTTSNITVTKKPTEVPDVTTSNITVTEKPTIAPEVTTSNISVTEESTEDPDITTRNISVTKKPTEALDVTTSNITVTEKPIEAPDVKTSNISVTEKPTQAPDVTTRNISVTKKPTEAPDVTTSNITVTEKPTEAPDVTTSNITVTEKPIEAPHVKTSNISVTEKPTEALDVTTNNITVTEKPIEAPDVKTSNISVTEKPTEAPDVTTRNISVIKKPTEAPDVTTSNITVTEKPTEAPDVTTSNITVTEKPTEAPDVTTSNITVTKKPIEAPDVTTSNIPVKEKPTEAPDVTTSNITVTEKPTEAPDFTTSNITVTEKPTESPDFTTINITVTEKPTIAPDVTTSNISVTEEPTEDPDITTRNISVTKKPTEAPTVTTSNIPVTDKPACAVYEEFKASMYDVNLIYINENGYQNSSETTNQIPRNEALFCHYAETVCFGEKKPENDSLSADKNVTYDHHHKEPTVTLELSINRDETSPVQPIFTGYFPESSNDSSRNYNGNFSNFKTISQICPILKHDYCKQNIKLNIYIKANYIENNTMTKYPNCTKESTTSDNVLHVECKDISFAEHNRHIEYTPPNPAPKQEMFNCQILTLKDQRSEYNKLHFINCSNYTKISNNKTESGDSNITPVIDSKKITIDSILIKNGIEMDNTEVSTAKEIINIKPENMVTIVVTENTNNCSHHISLDIDEGKIIDLDVNNKEKNLQNYNIKLLLSNCINNSSIINNEQPPKAELIIILKNESLNASNLEQFNGTAKDESLKQRIFLRCDLPNLNSSSNATSDKTTLQCESIDLELHNITGIEVIPLSQISNGKTATKSENKSIQELFTWYCNILELNNTSKMHQINKLYFDNCLNNVNMNNSTNKSSQNNVTPDGENRDIDVTKTKGNKMNNTENPSGKLKLSKDNLPRKNPKNMIKILITEKANNCSNHLYFIIDEGKIIDLDVNKNTERNLQNNIELELSSCIDVDTSITKASKPDSKVELTIILNSESLNASNLKQFNGISKDESIKQRILLRCDHPNLDLSSNAISDKTVLHCEPIDLVLNNITGVEISTNVNRNREKQLKKEKYNIVEGIGNHTKVNGEIEKDNELNTNKTVNNNATINNKSLEDNTKIVESKEDQKNISNTKKSHKNNKKSDANKEVQKISINQMFNRKKDIPNSLGQNSLALRPTERETILIIALLSIICSCILMVIAWRLWPKKREYNPTPTREPPNDEETAF